MTRSRFAVAAILCAMLITYASTIVGVIGPHYVPIPWGEALHRLIHMRYVAHGSDQRSDWMGNLVMTVPVGFLVAGWFSPNRPGTGRAVAWLASIAAFIVCLAFILAVKYAQLFFPPRTVTLNYVLAQSLGVTIGILLLGILRSQLADLAKGHDGRENLRLILRIHTGLLIVFMLMPLDFALNANDLAAQLSKLPDTVTALGDPERPIFVRVAMIVASMLAAAPIGALLTLVGNGRIHVGRSVSAAAWLGCFAMAGVYALTTMVISGAASLPAVGIRTSGIALGAWFMHWLSREDPTHLRDDFRSLLPWALPIYLLTLLAVNGLLSTEWTTPGASADHDTLGLLPLYNYYIVSKAQAAKNIVGHAVMYAPIGVMIWLWARRGGGAASFILATVLSAIVEIGRSMRPGLSPDINAVPLAGIAAWIAASLMPALWQMLASVAAGRTVSISLDAVCGAGDPRLVSRRRRRRTQSGPVTGDVETY